MKHILFIAACVVAFLALAYSRVPSQPYYYDEADYMYAVSLGPLANFLDEPARSFPEFVRTGISQRNNTALSRSVRQQDDVNVYRHWHGPLYYYWLLLAPRSWDERSVRLWSLAIPFAGILLVYAGLLWILPPAIRTLGAILGTALFAFSHSVGNTFELAPHALFAVCYLASLFCAAKAVSSGRQNLWYGAAICAGLAFSTLEVSVALILALFATAWMHRTEFSTGFAWMLRPFAAFCTTAILIWPGALLKLAFLKAYIFMAYLAVFRKNPWGEETFWSTWANRLMDSPVEWILIAAALVIFVRQHRAGAADEPAQTSVRQVALPFLLHAGFMMLATLRVNSSGPRYMLPFVPALSIFAGITVASWLARESRAKLRIPAAAAICILLLARSAWWSWAHPLHTDPRPGAMLSEVRAYRATRANPAPPVIVVPQDELPVLHYYFPDLQLRGYTEENSMTQLLTEADVDAVIYPGYPVRFEPLKLY